MNFKTAPDTIEKLRLLGDDNRFEPAGVEPMEEGDGPKRRPKPLPCVSMVSTPKGKKPVLKAMMTTACERDCYYCPFRAGRSKAKRITFSPDEMAGTFHSMERAKSVDGLFLSSGIIKGSVTTQDKLIDTAEILRHKYRYAGYIHLKIMPGAEYDQIRRSMQLADRVSVNLEGATEQRLSALAPKKDYWGELIQRLQWVSQIRARERIRSSVVTQFVVGAVGDTDLELLLTSEKLLQDFGLKRTYYSSFNPIVQTPFEHLEASPRKREFRLYQASFLLRDYGWQVEELDFGEKANLRLDIDPKQAWAEQNLRAAPVEVNLASRMDLLRIPGIGPKGADRILHARRSGKLTELAQLRSLGIFTSAKAAPYILLNGRQPQHQLSLF